MRHIHLDECQSTQSSFKELWAQRTTNDEKLLISSDRQLAGVGRRGSNWLSGKSALAMSASIPTQSTITLSPLAIGVACAGFFKEKDYNLFLKWPNDLINSKNEKVGGILCQSLDDKNILAGIGINLFLDETELASLKDVPYKVGHLNFHVNSKKEFAMELYQYILNNNKFHADVWNNYCSHLMSEIVITDGDVIHKGTFTGIDRDGAALVKNKDGVQRVFTGSLRVSSFL